MKPLVPPTNVGRKVGADDIHHKTADQPRKAAKAAAKVARHGARQAGKREANAGAAESRIETAMSEQLH